MSIGKVFEKTTEGFYIIRVLQFTLLMSTGKIDITIQPIVVHDYLLKGG